MVTLDEAKDHLKIEGGYDDSLLFTYIHAARSYVKSNTGLSDVEIERIDDLKIAELILVGEFYENRTNTISNSNKVNDVLDSILGMHSRNLL